jgi:solute carrier family 9B (sodium/hydrogen exchanger), member 1/2
MLTGAILILLGGFFAGQLAKRFGAPPLLGMIVAGVALGPQGINLLGAEVLGAADGLRTVAVMVILMKAGLGLDRDKLKEQGTVALRLGFFPAACEAVVVALLAVWLLGFDFLTGLLLGWIISAESPAVIVPGMLRLKSLGWGVKKGIPDAIMTGSALSDVLVLLIFSLLLGFLAGEGAEGLRLGGFILTPLQALPFRVVLEITLGLVAGFLAGQTEPDRKHGAGSHRHCEFCAGAGARCKQMATLFGLSGRNGAGLYPGSLQRAFCPASAA